MCDNQVAYMDMYIHIINKYNSVQRRNLYIAHERDVEVSTHFDGYNNLVPKEFHA